MLEHALDPSYAAALVLLLMSYCCSPNHSGGDLEIAGKLIDSVRWTWWLWTFVAALVPRAEIDGDIGDSHVVAGLMMVRLCANCLLLSTNGDDYIFINQLREKLALAFGNPKQHQWPCTEAPTFLSVGCPW